MDELISLHSVRPWLRHYPPGVDWAADLTPQPLFALLDQAAARFGDRPFLDFMDQRHSYRDIAGQVERMAAGLQRLGLGKGHRIGLFLPNCPAFVIAYYGALKAGATVVNFNPLYAPHELVHQVEDSGVELMVTLDLKLLYDKVAALLGRGRLGRVVVCRLAEWLPFPKNLLFPVVRRHERAQVPYDDRHISYTSLTAWSSQPAPVVIDPREDVAVIQYTGGTTGTPKGAMLTHANLWANARQCALWFPGAVPGEERMLGVLPLFHVFAMTVVMNLSVALGAEIILVPRFELGPLLALIQAKRPSLFPAVPTLYTAINTHPERAGHDLSSIRHCISGGAPLPLEVKTAFETNTGCVLVEGYGLSESSPVACCNPVAGVNKPGSIGLPLPGTEIEIVSLEDDLTVLPPGVRGQVCIRGPQVMKGYFNQPEETRRVLRHGRLYTGDVGVMDDEGYVFIVDRIKDLILCGGFNVYPRMVEEAIYQHPEVEECVVAGVPDPYRGQTVKAYVKLLPGSLLDAEGLRGFLRDRLSPVEMPRMIEFREGLPRTMIGKLSRKDLLAEERRRMPPPGHEREDLE
jgi:long-chain acyl-CoA synthetase